jgi:uncharacterized protein
MSSSLLLRRAYFVDAGSWMAHFDGSDQWHSLAETILRELTDLRMPLHTSDVMIFEFITLARRRRFSILRIEEWVASILESAEVTCTILEDLDSARSLIIKYPALPFSGFDASSLAVMERLQINRVFTVDDEFIKCNRFVDVRPNFSERKTVVRT